MTSYVDLVIATADRPMSLRETLGALREQQTDTHRLRLFIVDNGEKDVTAHVVSEHGDFEIHHIHYPERARSKAINSMLEQLDGDIVIFTDDDVTPTSGWLASYIQAFQEFDSCIVSCGPITPVFPEPCPAWIQGSPIEGILFARFEPTLARGPLPVNLMPLGPNFAMARSALHRLSLRENLGPADIHGALSCDDIDFLNEIRIRHLPLTAGGGFFFLPEARVFHRIRKEQLTSEWIFDRFFNYGRSLVAMKGRLGYFASPSCLLKSKPHAYLAEQQAAEFSYYLGQRKQLLEIGNNASAMFVSEWLLKYAYRIDPNVFGPLARSAFRDLIAM